MGLSECLVYNTPTQDKQEDQMQTSQLKVLLVQTSGDYSPPANPVDAWSNGIKTGRVVFQCSAVSLARS